MSYDDFCMKVAANQAIARSWRSGQAAFNTLHEVRPDLSERVRGTGLDPFYRDERLKEFYDFVEANW